MNMILFWTAFCAISGATVTNLIYRLLPRPLFSQVGGVAMAAGFALQTVMLTARSARTGRLPLGNPSEWALVAAWGVAAVALISMANRDKAIVRVLTGPVILALFLLAEFYLK